jgi:Flp pilus assembly pilin Flp
MAVGRRSRNRGAAMVEYAILVGAVTLVGILGLSVLGRKSMDLTGTLAVILPGANLTEDMKIHHAQLVELTGAADGTYKVDSARIGGGNTNRLAVAAGVPMSNSDSPFVVSGL